MFIFTTKTIIQGYIHSRTVQLAVDRLYRDMHMVLREREATDENVIHFEIVKGMEEEGFVIEVQQMILDLFMPFLRSVKNFWGFPLSGSGRN